jgi:hypothetical protein
MTFLYLKNPFIKLVFFIFLFINQIAFSQKNLTPGYIILENQEDTLKGFIENLNWEFNPNKIVFGSNPENLNTYFIKSLSAFGINDIEHYWIRKVDIDMTPSNIENLYKTNKLNVIKDSTLALRVLLKADMSLLYFNDQNMKEHFFYSDFDEVKELINHHYLVDRDGTLFAANNKIYQTQLNQLFSNCNQNFKLENLYFSVNSLVNLFIKFNECMGCSSTCYIKTNKDKPKFKIGISSGSFMSYNSEFTYRGGGAFEGFKNTPLVGLTTFLYSKRNRGNDIFLFEFFNQFNKLNYDINGKIIRWNLLNVSAIYRKRFNSEAIFKPFLGVGVRFWTPLLVNEKITKNDLYLHRNNPLGSLVLDTGFEIKKFIFSIKCNYQFKEDEYSISFYDNIGSTYLLISRVSRLKGYFLLTYQF